MTLQEINRRLDLLPEYLAYRANWMSKYGPVAIMQFFKATGSFIYNDYLMSFDNWLHQMYLVGEDDDFSYFENKMGVRYTIRKLDGIW